MKTPGDRLWMALASLSLLVVMAVMAIQLATEQKRKSAVARLTAPVTRPLERETSRTPGARPAVAGPRVAQPAVAAPRDPNESVAAYTKLFPQVTSLINDERWNTTYREVFSAKPPQDWTEDDFAQAKALAEEAHSLVLELRKRAALGGPAATLDCSKGASLELPHLGSLRHCARLLMIDAVVRTKESEYSEAISDIVAGFKLGDSVKDEGRLYSQYTRIEMNRIACTSASVLPPGGLASEPTKRIIDVAGQMGRRQEFADAFAGEGAAGIGVFEPSQIEVDGALACLPPGTPWFSIESVLASTYGSKTSLPWLNLDATAYAETMARFREAAALPYVEARPIVQQIERDIEKLPRTRVISRDVLPGYLGLIDMQALHEARLALLQTGLALELYHTQNRTYPASLDAVAPNLGGLAVVDPFNGKPLRYKPAAQSFVLYSVGYNLEDNGGQTCYRPNGALDFRRGDIVWRESPGPESEK